MSYAGDLRESFLEQADVDAAIAMAAYMRDQFPFFGLKKIPRQAVQRAHIEAHGRPSGDELESVVRQLWQFPERECQYAALDLLRRHLCAKRVKAKPADWLPLLEWLVKNKSWWDTVDLIAATHVGWALREDLALREAAVERWRVSPDFWFRRTAILFQLKYKADTDFELLSALCVDNLGNAEFFIRKAIGWALREYSKTDGEAVEAFVEAHPNLSGLSQREALKWLKTKA